MEVSVDFLLWHSQTYDAYYKPKRGEHGFQLVPILNRLKSRGFIKLRTTNPNDAPIIDPRYLTHPEDVHVAAEGQSYNHWRQAQ